MKCRWRDVVRSAAATVALAMTGGAALAGDLDPMGRPAVSTINSKAAIAGGELNGNGLVLGLGSVTMPLGTGFGLQLDGMAAASGGTSGGGAAHLFWRDPSRGLLGLYGSYSSIAESTGHFNVGRLAVEGQVYSPSFTLSGFAGLETGDAGDGFTGLVDLSVYPSDDLRLHAGYMRQIGRDVGLVGAEWVPDWLGSNVALFGDAIIGSDSTHAVYGGVRVYFGPDKALIRRHREDDPFNYLPPDLLGGTRPSTTTDGQERDEGDA